MRSWMIRHHNFTFSRPMSELEVVALIESGQVTAHDEIAASDGYWFSIQEVEEVKKYFGDDIHLQALIPQGIETTSSTNTALLAPSFKPAPKFVEPPGPRLETPKIKILNIEEDVAPEPRTKTAFGYVLVLIFVGTLLLLWLGSQ